MSLENALITLNKELAKAETTAQALRASIKALGGTVTNGAGKAVGKRKKGGWPPGKKRGPRKPVAPANENEATTEPEPVASPIAQARSKRAAPKPGASLAAAAS